MRMGESMKLEYQESYEVHYCLCMMCGSLYRGGHDDVEADQREEFQGNRMILVCPERL